MEPARTQPVDLTRLKTWLGRSQVDGDSLAPRHARLMAATLGLTGVPLQAGDALPPLWHWLYFLQGLPPAELGRDGHPARGGFLPPVPLPNRMWAGGRLRFLQPLVLGETYEKLSTISAIEHKRGRSGDLVFVTVSHELLRPDGERALHEEQNLVFRAPPARDAPVQATPAPGPAERTRAWHPDSTQLFRYSALTFNGHRIHYDIDYCREVEGYAGLVVHGPLSATLLAGLAQELLGRRLVQFGYRALRPAIAGQPLTLNARSHGAGLELWTALAAGSVSMLAEAQ